MEGFALDFEADSIVCREGDPSSDLYFLESGKLLVFTVTGTQVKAISRIDKGEFIGELSFFDGRTRSSNIIALEKSRLIQISKHEIWNLLPQWYLHVGQNITKKIRLLDKVIHHGNVRRSGSDESKPLSVDEQRKIIEILTKRDA